MISIQKYVLKIHLLRQIKKVIKILKEANLEITGGVQKSEKKEYFFQYILKVHLQIKMFGKKDTFSFSCSVRIWDAKSI